MKSAIILHTIEDADHCVANMFYKGKALFSTHSSVDIYLREAHGIECVCLSTFISKQEMLSNNDISSNSVRDLLNDMDLNLAERLNNIWNLRMSYFVPLYSYMAKHHFMAYLCFISALKTAVRDRALSEIIIYDYKFTNFLDTSTSIQYISDLFFNDIRINVIKRPDRLSARDGSISDLALKIRRTPLKKLALKSMSKMVYFAQKSRYREFHDNKKTVLLSVPLYELDFLKKYITKYNILCYDLANKRFLVSGCKKSRYEPPQDLFQHYDNEQDIMKMLVVKDIKEDFCRNIGSYLSQIDQVREIHRNYPIVLGIWGVSPAWREGSIIYEYLRSMGIKIIGAQHGGLYGDSFMPVHFDTDFNRCDYFLSYGFTQDDLRNLYPGEHIRPSIVSVGKAKEVRTRRVHRKIDILFPMTKSVSMFRQGITRLPPDLVAERQVKILEYLNTLKDSLIYVKPVAHSDYDDCATMVMFKRLKNLRLVNNVSLSEFLETNIPRAVVIEFPAQPLYDVIHLDTEIFLIGDWMKPFGSDALEALCKRVHYFDDVNEAICKLDLFLKGGLESKRDDTFYRHYIKKEMTEKNICDFVTRIIDG